MLQNEKYINTDHIIEPCNANCSFCFLNYTDVLKKNHLFLDISPQEIGQIIKNIHHQVKLLQKGDVLAIEGDSLNHLIIIVKGSLIGEMMDFEGKILRVEKISAPETVATAFLFGHHNKLPVSISATEESRLLLIPKEEILTLFKENSIVMRNFLDIISDRAQFMTKKIKLMSLANIKAKISFFLLELVKKQDQTSITLPHTHQELAEIFGVSRPSVGRAFKEMNESGCIKSRGKHIEITDRHKLSLLISPE